MNDFKLEIEQKIKSGFKISEHYFDTFSEKVMQLPKQEPKVISICQKRTGWNMAVARVLILALIIPGFNRLLQKTP